MKKNKRGQWRATTRLVPGKHEYRYFAAGAWATGVKCREAAGNRESKACVVNVASKMAA